ncbi:MAG: hypothetical protein ACPL0C_07190 [Candidatus Bathyarchaeales archaeon]
MKNAKKTITTVSLAFLLISMIVPTFLINDVKAANSIDANYGLSDNGKWWRIQTNLIAILFPASGKPMFLWWYANDTNNIYVVKYKGLIEYMTLDYEYYQTACEANDLTIQQRLEAKYSTPMPEPHRTQIRNRIRATIASLLGLHPSFLPFSACSWNLTGPVEVTRDDGVSYISFNFTLLNAPGAFDFADGNVVIRCRFYKTDATESVYGLYTYTVKAGELKMDLVIQNWEWNIDKLNDLFEFLSSYPVSVPKLRAGLALWVDLASIEIEDIPIAEQDANTFLTDVPKNSTLAQIEPVEDNYTLSSIIAGSQRIQVRNRVTSGDAVPLNVRARLRERFRLRFANESQTLAGFFDFVNTAVVINATDPQDKTLVDVTAAYKLAGNHMRLYIGYPYFGNNILEHDPSIGAEEVIPWLPAPIILILIGATVVIGVAVAAVKMHKKTINIVNVQ